MGEGRQRVWLLREASIEKLGWSLLLVLLIGSLGAVMHFLTPDENMYVAAGVLTEQGYKLYRDFAFLQMPYLALVYAAIFDLTGTSWYLLTGKLVSYFFLLAAVLLVYRISERASGHALFSLGVTMLFLLNHTILRSALESCNYIPPVALSLLAFFFFLNSLSFDRIHSWRIALAGLAVALAAGIKLYYCVLVLPFAVVLSTSPASVPLKTRIRWGLAPFLAGVLAGLLPILYYLDDLEEFYFNNFGYHMLNTRWRELTGYTRSMNLYSKLQHVQAIYLRADNLIPILVSSVGIACLWSRRKTAARALRSLSPEASLAGLLLLVSFLVALTPTPLWEHYAAMPISFLFLVLIYSSRSLFRELSIFRNLLFAGLVLALAYNGPGRVIQALGVLNPETWREWKPVRAHGVAMEIRAAIPERGDRPEVATLFPLYALEAGLAIYPELASGAFAYRVAGLIEKPERQELVTVAPEGIAELFREDPPDAILVGFDAPEEYEELEEPLIDFARENGYEKLDRDFGGATLYLRE